jgi:hypothetical protein
VGVVSVWALSGWFASVRFVFSGFLRFGVWFLGFCRFCCRFWFAGAGFWLDSPGWLGFRFFGWWLVVFWLAGFSVVSRFLVAASW